MTTDDAPRTEAEDAFTAAVNAPSATGRGIAVPHYRDAERIWQAIAPYLAIEAEAAAGPRDDPLMVALDRGAYWKERALRAEAAAGPRDVPTLPPPDLSLIDTLGEGTDPDRPVRIDYPPIEL